jgi:hypothetical protein
VLNVYFVSENEAMPRTATEILISAAAIWFVFAATEIARANPAETPETSSAVVSSDHGCDVDRCRGNAEAPASSHVRKLFAHHGPTQRHVPGVSAHHEPAPIIVTEVFPSLSGVRETSAGLVCTGIFAWSLLCPGSQLIGISY